jgi:tetraacyldisaccharide 4'-kinase
MASALRGLLRIAETPYAALMRLRNKLYDLGTLRSHRVAPAVISVGNITAGGTGKTPTVVWLASSLRAAGFRPAVLLRGYGSSPGAPSDEATLLDEQLNPAEGGGVSIRIPIVAAPDRVASAKRAIVDHPHVNLLILDDGFQHRRLARNFDLLLIDATNPFGFDHVHPRGLLREPLAGLRRAHAFIISRADLVPSSRISEIDEVLRAHNPTAPVYRARHVLTSLKDQDDTPFPLTHLAGHRFLAAAAIGNPAAFDKQLKALPGKYSGHHWLPDHHDYKSEDLTHLYQLAVEVNADFILTTEKDWTKLRRIFPTGQLPIFRVQLAIEFDGQGESGLLQFIRAQLENPRSP